MPSLQENSLRRAGARLLGVRLRANMWAIFVDGMAAGEKGLMCPWRSWSSQVMGEALDEPREAGHCSKRTSGLWPNGQVEQEVSYDAGLFIPNNNRSLKVAGS